MSLRACLQTAAVAIGLSAPANACDLALVLAVDVSGSVDTREYEIQMRGLAEALRDGAVSEALVVAKAHVMLVQWTGASRQRVTIPWTELNDFDATDGFADRVEASQRIWRNFSTAIGEAMSFATAQFDAVPQCKRRVVDVSGDGVSNEGIRPRDIRLKLGSANVTINGLAIEATDKGLTEYYRAEMIMGPGAFAIRAESFEVYPARIRQKLLREITKQVSEVTKPLPNERL